MEASEGQDSRLVWYISIMRYRKVGRTGYEVSEVGYGAWGIGGQLWGGADDVRSMRALHQAADLGLNFIDTALAYGNGRSEKLISRLLKERGERIYVATKVPPKNKFWPARGKIEEAFPSDHLLECIDRSLTNLRLERIDLIQLHVWHPAWLESGDWYETLGELKQQGKIAHWGVSVTDHRPDSALELVSSGKIDTVQVIYNIFDQSAERRLLPLCLEKQVGVIARAPLDEGALTGEVTPDTRFSRKDWRNLYFGGDRKLQVFRRARKLTALLDEETQTLPELALKFCLHHPAVSTVIPGMRSVEHVDANLAVSDQVSLSEEILQELRSHRWDKDFYQRP